MFWGMNLKPNRKYSQTTSKSFHISQAALDPEGADDTVNKIYISSEDNQKYLICTLRKNICEQVQLDLNFVEGDTICFQTIGSGNVSLSGYLTNLDYEEDFGEEEEDANMSLGENDAPMLNGKSAKKKKGQKKAEENDEEEDSDDDEDDDALLNAALESDDDEEDEDEEDGNEEDSDDESDDEEDDDEEDEEDEIEEPKKKIAKVEKKDKKQQKQQPQQQQQNGAQKTKKEKKAEKQQQQKTPQQQQQQQKSAGDRTLSGGVKIEDIRVGNGEEAKNGKRAQVYYEGRLKSNNKVFDSLKNGAPFKFIVGRGEVIKGWDIGVVGMKIGGKRRITCPPHMAYGARGHPPTIPPNSVLVFEVELKSVSK